MLLAVVPARADVIYTYVGDVWCTDLVYFVGSVGARVVALI